MREIGERDGETRRAQMEWKHQQRLPLIRRCSRCIPGAVNSALAPQLPVTARVGARKGIAGVSIRIHVSLCSVSYLMIRAENPFNVVDCHGNAKGRNN